MLEAEDILNGIVRGALGGRRKSWSRTGRAVRGSGLINANTLLAAAGVAWGLYETWQSQQQVEVDPFEQQRPAESDTYVLKTDKRHENLPTHF